MIIKENSLQIIAIVVIAFVTGAIVLMIADLHTETKGKQFLDQEVMTGDEKIPVIRERYQALVTALEEFYSPGNTHMRNIFTLKDKSGKLGKIDVKPDKTDIGSYKTVSERLNVSKTYKKPVELLFKGYLQLGDGTYIATINWGGKTNFKTVGDEIRGYKMVDFRKEVKKKKTVWGGEEEIDLSTIMLERTSGEKFELQIGKITLEKEIFAEIEDLKTGRAYDVHVGSEIFGHKVVDILPGIVIMINSNNNKVELKKGKKD